MIAKPIQWERSKNHKSLLVGTAIKDRLEYGVYAFPAGHFSAFFDFDKLGVFPTLEEAKAACQQHWDEIVRELLSEQAADCPPE